MILPPIPVIQDGEISSLLAGASRSDPVRIRETLAKGRELKGLEVADVPALLGVSDPILSHELHETARYVKQEIYGSRLVLFAPLYISNRCSNECSYCAFRKQNEAVVRRTLSQEEIAREIEILVSQGHKRVLMVAGEDYHPDTGIDYVLRSIRTIYATKVGKGEVRRVNVNVAPLSVEHFRQLKAEQIGTYQCFQETYHQASYERYHLGGPKRNYQWRLEVMDRALTAEIHDVGIGPLFGLYDWRYELLAVLQHARHLEENFGVGPHTISVPRLEPAIGSKVAEQPPFPVSDADFLNLVAILRIAVPYTGIIMSTRESAAIRNQSLQLGVSQISAGSRTDPGGYSTPEGERQKSQFQLGDHRSLDEVISDALQMGYLPSFCTGCYRMGRTGQDFMELAKPGEIKKHCEPNALSTFQEYLCDYASPRTRAEGEKLIEQTLRQMLPSAQNTCCKMLELIKGGKRDVYL